MPYDPQKDKFASSGGMGAFGNSGRSIVPSDSVDLTKYARAIVVTAAGNLAILPTQNDDDKPITFTDVPVGFVPPFRVRRVFATGTTAIVAAID